MWVEAKERKEVETKIPHEAALFHTNAPIAWTSNSENVSALHLAENFALLTAHVSNDASPYVHGPCPDENLLESGKPSHRDNPDPTIKWL